MAKPFVPQVVTANRLTTGDVVYLGADRHWVDDLAAAMVARDALQLSALKAIAACAEQTQSVVSVYEIEVDVAGGRAVPMSVKERIRAARGPTV